MTRHVDDVQQQNVRALPVARDDARVRVTADPPVAPGGRPHIAVAVASILNKLDEVCKRITDGLLDAEQEPDFDQTFVVGQVSQGGTTVQTISLPRTLIHVEITLSLASTNNENLAAEPCFLFAGPQTLAQVQAATGVFQSSGPTANLSGGQVNAICVTTGGQVQVRDYLDGSGVLTVFWATNGPGIAAWANVRVRNLDASQGRLQRT